jgi:GNAT superfamily N-acetyltransferase
VIADELLICASDNLVETYFRLGLTAPKAGIWEDEGFRACLGGFAHPICNFAVKLRLDPWSARRLAALARARNRFHVYVLPDDRPSYLQEILQRVGFHPIYSMISMLADSRRKDSPAEVLRAESEAARDRIADFMVRQFFMRQDGEFRNQVRWATFAAKDLDLHYVLERGRPIAAVMLSRSADVLGIYNLCVSPGRRRRGIGRSLVDWCFDVANKEGRRPTLQCDPLLERWYSSCGFRSIGRINVFSLPQSDRNQMKDATPVL